MMRKLFAMTPVAPVTVARDSGTPAQAMIGRGDISTFEVPHQAVTSTSPAFDTGAIARLVDQFYERVRMDPDIGPIFNAAVSDWSAHKRLLTSFWSTIALRANTYRGNPLAAHRPLPIHAEHFNRWIALWRETCTQELDDAQARQMVEYAERIGHSLRHALGIATDQSRHGLSIIGSNR